MPLRIKLKPFEYIIIGRATLKNGSNPADFEIEGEHIPIIRGRDHISNKEARTPCQRLQVAIQDAYLSGISDPHVDHSIIVALQEIKLAAPSLTLPMTEVSANLLLGEYYKAILACRPLRDAELLLIECGEGSYVSTVTMAH